ncbi:MAG: hypothetical protein INR62_04645 [Rhodospirillales bacterium]|nr:hypothetical protein [Acetobacter sp.]
MQRMGSSRRTAARLAGFVQAAQAGGTVQALRRFGLERCIGRPVREVLAELLEAMCPQGGRIDEGIARQAFQNAIVDFAAQDLPPVEQLTGEQWNVLFTDFLVRSIELRVIADVGQGSLKVTENVQQFREAAEVMHNVVMATVQEALGDTFARLGTVPETQLQALTDQAYERAWGLFEDSAADDEL